MSNELIKSILTDKQRHNFFKYVIKMDGCWDWTGLTSRGYGKFRVGNKKVRAHRLNEQMNANDKVVKGRVGTNKLTKEQVLRIREQHVFQDKPIADLANEFQVSYTNILAIVTRKTWRHI
jgi:hypothetical protein